MSSRHLRLALLITAFVFMPVEARAQTATGAVAPQQDAALGSPNSMLANATLPNSPLNVPIEEIAATAGGCAVLDKDFPGLRKHGMYPFFKDMTLSQIAAMSHGEITPDMLAQARSDLSVLPIKVAAQSVHPTGGEDLDFAPAGDRQRRRDGAHK